MEEGQQTGVQPKGQMPVATHALAPVLSGWTRRTGRTEQVAQSWNVGSVA